MLMTKANGRLITVVIAALGFAMMVSDPAVAQDDVAPAPPSNVQAVDFGWDAGQQLILSWDLSPDDPDGVDSYEITRSTELDGEYTLVELVEVGTKEFIVRELQPNTEYFFRVAAIKGKASSTPAQLGTPAVPTMQWFDLGRFWLLVIVLVFCGAVVFWIAHARGGKPIKVRKIGGLEAVDEAVGRATEMGRPCLFVPGIQDINEIQTIAGLTVLSHVSKIAAEFDAKVEVPTARSLVMTAARETVEAAFLEAGRPDAYNNDLIYYVTDEQFGYVAYLQGMMVREKPAACFYMGVFYAESLILAETGNSIGAIQIAGTAMPAQLPFFVAACDYTLIGEEFFAASAYLSGSPEQLGSLKGQDVGKVIVGIILIVGVGISTLASMTGSQFFADALNFLKQTVLA